MSVRRAALSVLSVCLLTTALAARETPIPAGSEPVTLAYKFRTGDAQRFRGNVNTSLTLEQDGGPFGPIPVDMKALLSFSQKVTGTSSGTGTLVVALDSLILKVNAAVAEFDVKLLNGKLSASAAGQPLALDGDGPQSLIKGLIPTRPIQVRRNPRGATTPVDAGATASLQTLIGGALLGSAIQLPEGPVQVGDTWEWAQRVSAPSAPGAPPAVMLVRLTSSLKEIESAGGRRIAVIETIGTGSAEAGEGAQPEATQNLSSTARFDVARGALVGMRANLDLRATTGAAPAPKLTSFAAAQLPTSGRVDATMEIKFDEAPPAPAKKPAAKKPAAKPARKR